MSKRTICLLMAVMLMLVSVFGASAEEVTEDLQLNTEVIATTAAESVTAPTTAQPTTEEIIPADYPALTVNAISNFFPNATAEYCATKRQVEVTYSLRCSKNMMNVQWFLYYDPEILTISKERNTPASICPAIGNQASVSYGDGVVSYCSSSIRLYDFSTTETPFVKILFDVNELDPEEANITKVDLTVDVLCASDLDPQTKRSDPEMEKILVLNTELYQKTMDVLRLSRNTLLTQSNFVQATPDEPETTVEIPQVVTASTDATVPTGATATAAPDAPPSEQDPEKDPALGPVSTGAPWKAWICFGALAIATSALFVMRKKEILFY
ncbi:MAG: hypothetical protein IJ598_11460 [Ruminococcus sp.]|nr:hypothetical protein [Ruminococcus sp.]